MKRIASILMCALLIFSLTVMVFADPVAYTITVKENDQGEGAAVDGETYTAYKIFDVTYDELTNPTTNESEKTFRYTINTSSPWWGVVSMPASGTAATPDANGALHVDGLVFTPSGNANEYIVTEEIVNNASQFDEVDFAAKLYAAVDQSPAKTAAGTATGSSGEAEITVTNSGPGYYFVTTSVGALCALSTTSPEAEVYEKNSVPSIDKEVSNGGAWGESTNASIGDTVNFRITVTDGRGTDDTMTVSDIMTPGLTLHRNSSQQTDITVTKDGNTVASTNYTLTVNDADPTQGTGEGFEIVFTPAFVATVGEDDEIIITYSAELNEDAYIYGNQDGANNTELKNTNTVELTYGAQVTSAQVWVDTYRFQIVKTTSATYGSRVLDGAKFKIYDAQTGGNIIPVVLEDAQNNVYRFAVGDELSTLYGSNDPSADPDIRETEGVEIVAGVATFIGFGNGTYYLEETEAPDGYNILSDRVAVQISSANRDASLTSGGTAYETGGIQVINYTGGELPSTGGIGTYLFYGIGALLVVGAVVVLVSRKRMRAYEA